MNILIVTTSFPSYKNNSYLGKFVLNEALAYVKNDARVKVLTPHFPGADRRERICVNLEVIRIKYFWPNNLQKLKNPREPVYDQKSFLAVMQIPFLFLSFICQILKYSHWADIVHCQWTITALLALPSKLLYKKKIVLTARGSDIRLIPEWLNRFIHKQVHAAIDCFGPQQWNIEYRKKFNANFIKLPLIIEYASFKRIPDDLKIILRKLDNGFIIFYVGRLDFKKSTLAGLPIINLAYAAKELKKLKKKFHICYIGDGDSITIDKMKKIINENNLGDVISFLGPKNNVNDYLPYCDLGVGGVAFNAVSEEFSCSKKPQLLVEGYDNLHTPWRDKENTIFFKKDNVDSLVQAICYAMEDNERLDIIGKNAFEMMSQYVMGLEEGGKKYLKTFQKIIEQA